MIKGKQDKKGESLAKVLDEGSLLLLANLLILLLVSSSLETLPWQATPQKVHEDVTQRLQIISSGLFPAQMSVDAHVPGGTRERLALAVWNVLLGLRIAVLLSHTEVDYVDHVRGLSSRPAD